MWRTLTASKVEGAVKGHALRRVVWARHGGYAISRDRFRLETVLGGDVVPNLRGRELRLACARADEAEALFEAHGLNDAVGVGVLGCDSKRATGSPAGAGRSG